jgi:hypothetical protein
MNTSSQFPNLMGPTALPGLAQRMTAAGAKPKRKKALVPITPQARSLAAPPAQRTPPQQGRALPAPPMRFGGQ